MFRIPSLDGLRGIAALAVVFHHLLLLDQWFVSRWYPAPHYWDAAHPLKSALYLTPLHLFAAGQEAVQVFFVLSGVVLVRAIPLESALRWRYQVARFLRLAIPIWASLALALAWRAVFHPGVPAAGSWWFMSHLEAVTAASVLKDMAVVFGTSHLNSSLWSMQMEVLWSVFLAAGIWLGRRGKAAPLATCVVLIAFGAALERSGFGDWRYASLFLLGAVIAQQESRRELRKGEKDRSVAALLAGCFSLVLPWASLAFDRRVPVGAAYVFQQVGALLIVIAAAVPGRVRDVLGREPFVFLGARSYSLYLVHAPIVVWLGSRLLDGLPIERWGWHVAILLGVIAVVTEAFYRLVEAPAHALGRRLYDGAAARTALVADPVPLAGGMPP